MDKKQAKTLIQETFTNTFDRTRFIKFVKELLNEIDESKHGRWAGQMIKGGFGDDVKYYERIGTYTARDGGKIDILVIYLKKESTLERARTKQRNFVAHHLKTRAEKDAGLVAFVSPNTDDWRFSLVKMEYHLEQTQEGKVKVEEDLTPAKRFSFIVGKNENSHTAQKQLLPILEDDKNNPTLKEIEKAFSIEAVTKEFFNKYKDLFLNFKEEFDKILEEDKKITEDFSDKGINTANFAKKLLGQIVFLYFLQRKGWLGVYKNSNWGSGPKNFLRALFEKKYADYKNFFNDILEPLFYEALATDRGDKAYYSRFDCRIPFLNGGLFEPIQNYDWENTDIIIPNDLFSNEIPTKEGDKGSGIMDFFDRYNFTIKEDEPLEKEVAIDPEMLGKVFENLLEIKDRKSKGAYYTPREIVHYMCQESLINYLATELSSVIPDSDRESLRKDIETFIHLGDFAVEHDMAKTQGIIKDDGKYKLPQSIHENAELIDRKLAEITVCDPAIGSGAFLVGMMNEIIRARGALNATKTFKDTKSKRTPYAFKRHAIQNSLYGVDIDPGAVEIAKLRLWLSLVVDEEEMTEIKPLPNLDYKIMQGNSLLEEYEGIKLFDESLLGMKKGLKDATQMTIGDFGEQGEVRKKLEKLHEQFFESSQRTDKKEIKKQIDELEWELIEETLKEQGKEKELPKLQALRRSNNKPFFLWKLHFAEVFLKKGGFDVVIANPPYIRADSEEDGYLKFRRDLENTGKFQTVYEKWDIMVPFIEWGLHIGNHHGQLVYIVSNAICTSKYALRLLDLIQDKYFVNTIDYFDDMQVFDAGVIPIVLNISKNNINYVTKKIVHTGSFSIITSENELKTDEFKKLGRNAFRKEYMTIKIGILTVPLGDICYISYGLRPNSDERFWKGEFTARDIIRNTQDDIYCRRYIEGKNIENYIISKIKYLEWNTDRVPKKLVRPTFPELYENEKLLRGVLTGGIYDNTGLICNHSTMVFVKFITLKDVENRSVVGSIQKFNCLGREELEKLSVRFDLKYLLAIMNSKFANSFLNNIRRHRLKNYFYPDDFRNLPIADISRKDQQEFVVLVDKIIGLTNSKDYLINNVKQKQVKDFEHQIDELVHKLYNLTPQEIEVVKNFNK